MKNSSTLLDEFFNGLKPTVDILAQLGVVVENQFDGLWGITDDAIRGMADQSYQKTGIMDESLRGWTLSMRPSDSGSGTSMDMERKVAIVALAAGDELFSGSHEFAHVLSGPDFLNSEDVPSVAKEYVAIAAEAIDPQLLRSTWSFELQNTPILGLARNINLQAGMIHAAGAPLDGWRYDLLRLTDEVIGEEGQVRLAKDIWQTAHSRHTLNMDALRDLFRNAGLAEISLFHETLEPGLYVEVVFDKQGNPIILAKTVDKDGYEGLTQVPLQVVWRDQDGKAIASGDPQPLTPAVTLIGANVLSSYAASLELRIAGEPYIFRFEEGSPGVGVQTKQSVPSITKFD